jgi:hypothetical protein
MQSRLYDGVLLGVNGAADFMPLAGWYIQFIPKAPQFEAILAVSGCPVVAGGKNMLVFNRHRPDMMAQAGGSLGDYGGNL